MPSSTTVPTTPEDVPQLVEREAVLAPQTRDELLEMLKLATSLARVSRIEITPKRLVVKRVVHEREEVFPDKSALTAEIEPGFLLPRLVMTEIPARAHAFFTLQAAVDLITDNGLRVIGLWAPQGELVGAWLGLPNGSVPRHVFGHAVTYMEGDVWAQKIVVIGGPTQWLSDATHAMVIDPWEEPV